MKVTLAALAMLSLTAASAGAQANSDPDKIVANGGVHVPGWTGRIDPRAATQGRKITEASFTSMGSGIHVTAGPAAIYWNPANSPTGNYGVKATFNQTKASTHPEGYGLLMAGHDLDSANQSYLYFLVAQDGTWIVKRRDGDAATKDVAKAANDAVKKPDASGKSTNALEVRVAPDKIEYLVNGTVVTTTPKTGDTAKTDGLYGIRVNHQLEVQVDGLSVAKK